MTIHVGTSQPRAELQGPIFVLIGLGLGAMMIAAGQAVYAVQGTVATVASLLPFGYAFAAGMVATVNPCGVLLLPSLAAYYLQRDDGPEEATWQRAGRALLLSVMATLGFVTVFT